MKKDFWISAWYQKETLNISPSFDNVMVQGSSYKMSDIEALNYIAPQTQKTQLLKNDWKR